MLDRCRLFVAELATTVLLRRPEFAHPPFAAISPRLIDSPTIP